MKRLLLTWLAALAPTLAFALPEPAAQPAATQPAPTSAPLRARLTRDLIGQAVRDTLGEQAAPVVSQGQALGADPYREFARKIEQATVPHCLHPDGLKRQPTYFLTGLLALSYVPIAKLRGKCK